ncbi:hypothetical protein RRG08_020768 [Elysia crispata]|uniref:Uncharacterized protein n=1 Tax=Elysia crispata TaxID=231223 RepID=A0AAE1AS17_9GAST|nr:hypothetical protein RRG08_020768 [Elysia crispata]
MGKENTSSGLHTRNTGQLDEHTAAYLELAACLLCKIYLRSLPDDKVTVTDLYYKLSGFVAKAQNMTMTKIRAHTINNTTTIPVPRVSQARVRLFTLKNHNFKNFNRFWENKEFNLQRNHRNSQQKTGKKEVPYDPGAILDLIEEDHVLPECITLRFRRPLQPPTKVCVHSRREDNVISNQLRDFGNWEPDLLDQMQTFLEVGLLYY